MRLAAALLLLVAAPAAAQEMGREPGAIRLSELRRASDDEIVGIFFGRLRTFPYVGYRDRAPDAGRRRGVTLNFFSRPAAADRPGLCWTQRFSVRLRATTSDPDPLMQPAGQSLEKLFIIENRDEARRTLNPSRRSDGERRSACQRLDPSRDGIPAESAYQLMRAIELTEALGAGARAGRAAMPLDCSRMNWNAGPPPTEAACLAEFGVLTDGSVRWVQSCRPQREAPGGCIRVMTDNWWLEFDMNLNQTPQRAVVEAFEDMSQVNWVYD